MNTVHAFAVELALALLRAAVAYVSAFVGRRR